MTNLIGQSLGRYHILEQLGEGGMATVYKAFDTRLESDVAVKVIRTDALAPNVLGRTLKRFEREAKALARLTHPSIVKVTDYGEYENIPYLVMPFLSGGNLKQYLIEHGRLPWPEAIRLLLPIAHALEYAHNQNVIHRDVKPSNILLTQDGQPMLTDFGVAKVLEEEATLDLTGTGAAVGTPEYMAPEQVSSNNIDCRVDIYSMGVVLYEIVTGRKPYQADTPMAVMIMQARDPLPRPVQFVPDLPEKVEQILLKALAKKPESRYQDMGAFIKALERVLGTETHISKRADEQSIDRDLTRENLIPESAEGVLQSASANSRFQIPGFLKWLSALGIIVCLCVGISAGAGLILWNNGTQATRANTSAPLNLPVALPSERSTIELIPSSTMAISVPSTLIPSITSSQTLSQIPTMFDFRACLEICTGNNSLRSFPEKTTKIYIQWRYENIPTQAHYIRIWTQGGREWVRYECSWPNPSSGEEKITLTEPDGLYSGEWVLTILLDNKVLLQENITVQGHWTYWSPAGYFNSCYGKR